MGSLATTQLVTLLPAVATAGALAAEVATAPRCHAKTLLLE